MKRIVWAEGVLLGQQHLQQFDHYHHERQDFLARLSSPYPWGIKKLIWDEKSLLFGKIIIKYCEVVFPQGLIIRYDSRVDLPLSVELTTEHEKCESIYLAIPLSTHVKDITGYPNQSGLSGWNSAYQCILDEYDVEREREVLCAHPNLYLLSSKEDRSVFFTLKILEVFKKNVGEFYVEPMFIPSCLSLSASERLMGLLRVQIELVSSKANLLNTRRKQSRIDWLDYVLLQLFHGFLAELQCLKSSPQLHPFELYKCLIRFIGALIPAVPLPDYDHQNLTTVFYELDRLLKQLIDDAIPTRTSNLQWIRESEFLYVAENLDIKKSLYVAVIKEGSVMEWFSHFTHEVKIGARSVIESIVASALTGVTLIHVQRPPHQLSLKSGYEYFYIEPKGSFWEQVKAEQCLALFVSQNFSTAHIELLTVDEDE